MRKHLGALHSVTRICKTLIRFSGIRYTPLRNRMQIEPKEISNMGLNILHLSDIHICGDASPSVGDLLLGNDFYNGAPNIILVTGDFFDYRAFNTEATTEETQMKITNSIEKGITFCEELIQEINAYYDVILDKGSFLFVPGNHEVNRSARDATEYLKPYRTFIERFYSGNIPNWYLDDLTFVRVFSTEKVIVIGFRSPYFHSTSFSSEEPYDDYGLIDAEQLLKIRKALHIIENRDDYSIVAALHHQFILMEERKKSYVDRSYLRNNEQFIKFLAEENICAVFHGHKHYNSNRRLNIELDITKPEKIITVLGCGSLSEIDHENWFNYITVFPRGYRHDMEYSSYRRTNAGYIINKEAIRIPVISQKTDLLVLKNAISNNPDLNRAYHELLSYDYITEVESICRVLDSTLFSLPSIVEHIIHSPDLLFFILATAHYRCLINRSAPRSIIEKVDGFIKEKKNRYFPNNTLFDQISQIDSIIELVSIYQSGIDALTNTQKKALVFSSMTTMIIDYYSIMKYRSADFYKNVISKKTDFVYSGNLASELRGNTVGFSVDDDRRLLEISVTCDTAEAVKICSLIIKEFEIILHDFERDFSDFGFRIYYVLPKLKYNGRHTHEIESRQFSAYIPKLLPLLAGRNIYSRPEAFSREVIQNSIDAINVRKEQDPSFNDDGEIHITIGSDTKSGLSFFEIKDNGSGMTKYVLERYLTTLGLSYYTGPEFQSLDLEYNPISQFGIGFLSCFMIGKHIEVFTRHHASAVGYYLDIPNYDGCFFIEEEKGISEVGTRIRIYENPEQKGTDYAFDAQRIRSYLLKYIKNTSINIYVNSKLLFPKNLIWREIGEMTPKYKVHFFVPIEKINGTWCAAETKRNEHRFGIHFYKPDEELYSSTTTHTLLNDGILIPFVQDNSRLKEQGEGYFYITANMPPDTLNLSVSRDNLKNFAENIDWESIKTASERYRKRDLETKAPYYILQKIYNAEKCIDNRIIFLFDCDNEAVTIKCVDDSKSSLTRQSIISFLNYISGNLFVKSFNLPLHHGLMDNDSFATGFFATLLGGILSITDSSLSKHMSVSALKKEYDSTILDVIFRHDKPFHSACVKLANELFDTIKRHPASKENCENALAAIEHKEKAYFDRIRRETKSNITNMFKDRRHTATDSPKTRASAAIKKLLKTAELNDSLYKLFVGFFAYAYTSINKRVSLIDVVGITVAAIYSLIDIACIVVPYDGLKKGLSFKVKRSDLKPDIEWFNALGEE